MNSRNFVFTVLAVLMTGIILMSGCTQKTADVSTKQVASRPEISLDSSYSKNGVSFNYPSITQISEKPFSQSVGNVTIEGYILEGNIDREGTYLDWEVVWISTKGMYTTDENAQAKAGVEGGISGAINQMEKNGYKITNKDHATIENNGHQVTYQTVEAENILGTKHYYCVISGFYCDQSKRVYSVIFMYDKENVFELYEKFLRMFKCH